MDKKTRKPNNASVAPMHTSITECCFRNMVDMMISAVRVKDAAFISFLSRSASQFVSDIWIARELNT